MQIKFDQVNNITLSSSVMSDDENDEKLVCGVDLLKSVVGNLFCADCSTASPDWVTCFTLCFIIFLNRCLNFPFSNNRRPLTWVIKMII